MVWLKKIWGWITWPVTEFKRKRKIKKRIEELKKQDPFIYK
jgi:hypothetical protein